jgi:alanine-glyoxylate transaminase/serine-glyoxylate transaminase/serine-pyruvate transaminase
VRPQAVEARLRRDLKTAGKNRFKAVLVVQIDTASGVVNDLAAIGKAIKASGHDALYMVDAVASLACMPFEMDAWGIDIAMSGSQKGLMTPPGLSFVAAGKRARAAHKRADLRTPYWDWTAREGKIHYQKYAGTAPEHLMFGLGKAFEMIRAEGLDNIFRRHRLLAEAVRRAVAVWARGKALEFNITAAAERSDTVTTVLMAEGRDARQLRDYCNSKCGVVLGQGLGDMSGKAFRIAHMGHINAPMVLGTLGVVECALEALGLPHRKGGVQAAIDWLGAQVEP